MHEKYGTYIYLTKMSVHFELHNMNKIFMYLKQDYSHR